MLKELLNLDEERKTSVDVLLIRYHKNDTLRVLVKANLNLGQEGRAAVNEADDLLRHSVEKRVIVIRNEFTLVASVPPDVQVPFEVLHLLCS